MIEMTRWTAAADMVHFTGAAPATPSLAVALAALVVAALFWFIGGHTPRLVLLLVLVASLGLAGTSIGANIHGALTSATDATAKASHAIAGGAVGILVALVLGYVLAIHWRSRRVSYWTLGAGAALPFTAAGVPGVVGQVLVAFMSAVAYLFTALAGWVGIH
jgi:hypothetical protein